MSFHFFTKIFPSNMLYNILTIRCGQQRCGVINYNAIKNLYQSSTALTIVFNKIFKTFEIYTISNMKHIIYTEQLEIKNDTFSAYLNWNNSKIFGKLLNAFTSYTFFQQLMGLLDGFILGEVWNVDGHGSLSQTILRVFKIYFHFLWKSYNFYVLFTFVHAKFLVTIGCI